MGTVILVVGVVLFVALGPGLVVIALALAVFAIEYQWARRNLAVVQARARSAALKAAASRHGADHARRRKRVLAEPMREGGLTTA